MQSVERAARELGNDVEEIGEDLELASLLVDQAGSPGYAPRDPALRDACDAIVAAVERDPAPVITFVTELELQRPQP